jgi:hypothetical protein
MLRTLEGFGRYGARSFCDAPLTEQEKRDVRYIDQVTKFAAVLEDLQTPRISGQFLDQLASLRKRLDSLVTTAEASHDRLLEIEIAAALAKGGFVVSMEEPDLVVGGIEAFPTIAIPVKRPRSANSVDGCLRKAAQQARARGLPAVVLVCLDAVMNTGRDGRPLEFWSHTRKGLRDGNWQRFKDTTQELEQSTTSRTDPVVIGLAWLARMPGAVIPRLNSGEGPSYARDTFLIGAINQDHWDGRAGPLTRLLHVLERGLP